MPRAGDADVARRREREFHVFGLRFDGVAIAFVAAFVAIRAASANP